MGTQQEQPKPTKLADGLWAPLPITRYRAGNLHYYGPYWVSDRGQVIIGPPSQRTARGYLAQSLNHGGYLRVRLRQTVVGGLGPVVQRRVHLLVLEAFRGPAPSPQHEGAHLDGDKTNNALSNLEWKLRAHNEADKKRHGTQPKGGAIKPIDAATKGLIQILTLGSDPPSISALARRYKVSRRTVARILRGSR